MVLLNTLVNWWYSEGILKRSRASASFAELVWISEEQRQILKLLEPRSFNMYKNAVAPIIVILGYLEVNIEISDISIEIVKSDNCREVLENDGDANGMLAIMSKS